MSRRVKPITMRLLLSALTAVALSAGVLPAARAAGYVFQQHVVNAGVLVNGTDPAPYVFYVLNNRPDVRPTDLTLINPLASSLADPTQAAYWEVQLNSVSDSQMAQFNVLYLRADGITFGPALNEKLRRFVDNGGQLIVEYGTPSVVANGLFTGTGAAGSPSMATLPSSGTIFLRHPIISQPYLLSTPDVNALTTAPNTAGSLIADANDQVHSGEFSNIFSPVLANTAGSTVVYAAQVGAGQVVATTLSLGVGISIHNGITFAKPDLAAASASDLKLLANILTWTETHPNQNKSSHGNASGSGLASFSPTWQYPAATTNAPSTPPGAAVWGNFVYAVDSAGVLHAFDAYPSEKLTNGSSTDDGITDYSTGTPYDEIWNNIKSSTITVGQGASAPTVASFKGVNIFVEKSNGSVVAFDAVTGAAVTLPATPALIPTVPAGSFPAGTNAPSPTYYDGRIYAGQSNGTLAVYDLNENSSSTVLLDPNTITALSAEYVTGPPSVGTVADGDTNVLVALVPTNYNLYSVLLGARNEPLTTLNTNGALVGYRINRYGRYELNNIFADVNAVPSLLAYDYNGNVNGTGPTSTPPNPQDPLFAIVNNNGYYTDWDMDFPDSVGTASNTNPVPVNLSFVSASSYADLSSPTPGAMSAPAIDRHGDYYYTSTNSGGSTLVGVHSARSYSGVRLKFRFQIPAAADATSYNSTWGFTDADGVNYKSLFGYSFVGSPVVDDQDNVYAVAVSGSSTIVLCFRGDQQVSAVLPSGTTIDLVQGSTITQSSLDNLIQRGEADGRFGQYNPSAISLDFYNFGRRGRTSQEIGGNLTEPQPVTATSTDTTQAVVQLQMRTNVGWFTSPFTVAAGGVTGLSRVGGSLFLSDGTNLFRISTTPPIPTTRIVTTPPAIVLVGGATAGTVAATAGAVGAPPSVGGSVMVINGQNGLAALTRQVTVIADNNRILGVDGDGSAVWSVDATTRVDTATGFASKVQFSHPTSLSQYALNDYLVADTGNNRCVRFDSGGNVQWELTRFIDPSGLMAAGQPLTISQPSSVVTRIVTIPATAANNPNGTITYYLVADSGNDRVLEVTDTQDANGNFLSNHVLTWVSHTGDRDGRHYRYGCATYYANTLSGSGYSIAATVTNTQIGKLPASGGLGPVSADSPGGSLVVFNQPATSQSYTASAPSDLAYTTAQFYANTGTTASPTYKPFTIRSPRFLQLNNAATAVSPQPGVAPAFDFLYADDNGAFDLTYDTAKKAFIALPGRLQFTQTDYDGMGIPALGVPGTSYVRTGLPFVPTCIQIVGSSVAYPRYLITQSYSQGELNGPAGQARIGGEIFEVDGDTTSTAIMTQSAVGGFGTAFIPGNPAATPPIPDKYVGDTLSGPGLTGPLTQPTFAVRLP